MAEHVYPRDRKRWIAFGILTLALFIISIDNSVLNLALPSTFKDLGISAGQLQWMTDAYILVFAALLFIMDAIGDRNGRKRILQLGVLLFGIGALSVAL